MTKIWKMGWLLLLAGEAAAGGRIERLGPPRPVPLPQADPDEDQFENDLRRMQERRHQREERDRPPPTPYAKKRRASLMKEATAPFERGFLMELSLVLSTAVTSGARGSYTSDPTTHFNLFWRRDPGHADDHAGLWYGFRLAPFAGTGFYRGKPGTYGLTYFGPMIGVGKIDRVPELVKPQKASGETEAEIPGTSGWLVTGGLAAVSRAGRSDTEAVRGSDSDFGTKGVAFDAPGLWAEARYLSVLYGALGYNLFGGLQSGRQKVFVYLGAGIGAWN